jgi:hypothetical protein
MGEKRSDGAVCLPAANHTAKNNSTEHSANLGTHTLMVSQLLLLTAAAANVHNKQNAYIQEGIPH